MTEVKSTSSNHPFSAESSEASSSGIEEQFRLVLEASPDGFIMMRSVRDAAGIIVDFNIEYANSVAARGVNLTPEELQGQDLLSLFPDCKTSGIFDRYVMVAETGISETFETFYDSKDVTGWFRNVVVKLNDRIAVSFSNITDRKQAELALQQQEQHFRIALQTAQLGCWEHDLMTGVLTCSAQYKANFGLPPDAEFTYETLFAALHPDDRSLVQAAIQRCIEQRIDYEIEERCYHPDGSLHWLIVRGQLVYDSKGTPIRLVGVTLDITEQKQFEESLSAANQRLSNVLESITDAFVAFDRDWCYTYVNQEAARMLGRSPQELIGQRWQDVFPEANRQDTVTGQALQQAMTERITVRLDAFSVAAQRWVEMSIFPSSDGVAVSFHDITERKRAEKRRDAQYAIARILAEATTVAEATPSILQALCEHLDWQVGMIWNIDSGQSVLRCINAWQAPDVDVHQFVEANQKTIFRQGVGVPGQVWMSHQPIWITELNKDHSFPRAALAAQVGLKTAFGFPILLSDEILGVIECFSNRVQEPDPDLSQMMAAIGSQIGQFMERKRTEAALQESQELFQSFMNHSPVAAFIKDETGRYLYANPWVERVYQRPQSDLIGKTDFDLLPTAVAQQFHANDAVVLASGQSMQTLETIPHEDGEHSYMSFKFPFRNLAGQQVLAGVAIDISERIQAEVALQQREAELRLITDAVPVLISLVDAEQRYRFNNQKYEEWFGKPATEMNGKYLWEVLGQSAYETIRPYVEQVLAGHEVTFESRIPYKEGGIRDAVVNYVPRFDPQGTVEGFVALVTDITRRKRAEETLQQSEERLRIAQQAANAGVWDWDITQNRVTWSEEYYRLYGLSPSITQPSYENWLDSIVEQDHDRVDQAAREALEHQIDLNVEFRILHPTQGERWLTAIGQTFYDDNQRPTRMIGIALDITDRKRSEAALRRSEERFQLIAKATNDVMWDCNLLTDEMWWSERLQLVFGYQPEEMELDMSGWAKRVHPDDAARVHTSYETCLNSDATVWTDEYHFRRVNGSYADVLDRAYIIRDSAGIPVRVVGAMADITERKRVQQELQQTLQTLSTLIQASPLPIVVIEPNMTVQLWNPAAEQLFGWSAAEVLGQPLPIVPEEKREECRQVREAIATGETFAGVETYRCKRDGSTVTVSMSAALLYDQPDHFNAFLLIFQDITEQQQAEQALRRSEEQAQLAIQVGRLGTWRYNLYADLVEIDERMREIWGEPDYVVALPLPKVLERIHPSDRERVAIAISAALTPGSSRIYEIDYRIIWDDGTERWISVNGQVQFEGEPQHPINFFGTALDITDRKQAEAALRNGAERLSLALTAAKLGDWSWNVVTDIVTFSDRAAEIFGIPPSPSLTWTEIQNLLHPQDRDRARLQIDQAIAGRSDYDIEYRVIHPNQVERWVAVKGRAQYDGFGQVLGMLGVIQDITNRKQAEQALQLSENRYRTLANAVPQLMWTNASDGTVEFFNQRWLEYTGTPLDLILKTWTQFIHPEDTPSILKLRARAIQAGEAYEMEVRLRRFDQSYRWHLARVVPLKDEYGRVLQWFGTATDIDDVKQTEEALRQSEERYRYLAESIPQLVWTADAEGVLIDANQRWSNFTGLTLAQAPSKGWKAIIHPDDVATLSQNWARAQQDGTYYQAEGRMRRADGVYRWHLHQAVPLKNQQGQLIKWFGTATDIEDQKQLEQQRIQLLQQEQAAREQAEAANRIKDEFLAVLSHELRSPLNPILGWAKLLQTRQFDQVGTKRALETIERNAKLQTQLIDDLLDVSRILRGKIALNVCPINLVTVVDAALETVRLSAEVKGIEIQKVVANDIGLILGDSGRLQQIVWNLLSNAVKFTPNGGQIEIRLEQVGSDAQITVTDTGKGIAPEFLPYVFDYFRQEDSTTTRKFGGLGLGLAIVRYLTELHGGTVKAESPGEELGATFTVLLPISKDKDKESPHEVAASSPVTETLLLADLRVLVVDDEADMRELLLTILEQTGAEVKVAASAIEALETLNSFKPDILISDIGMPEINGYELLRRLRRLPPEQQGRMPAIALTAYAAEVNQQQALAAGFQKHIAKPVEPDELVKAIVTLVKV